MQEEQYTNSYATVPKKEIEWLWYPYFAFGKVTLLQGDPGDGKSTFILQLAALLSQGKKMPDGSKELRPMNVIYQSAEDDPADTIRPRLEAAGADCNRIHYITDEGELTLDDYRIEISIRQTGAGMIVFDPIQAYIPKGADMQSAAKMRGLLGKVAAVAEKCHCAIVLIGHMNKDGTNKSLYRSLGSVDIPAIARSVLMISKDEEHPEIRHVEQVKSNLAPEGPEITFAVSRNTGFQWYPVVENGEIQNQDLKPLQKTMLLAEKILTKEDIDSRSLFKHFELLGTSESTVRRALRKIGATSYKKGTSWYYHLEKE